MKSLHTTPSPLAWEGGPRGPTGGQPEVKGSVSIAPEIHALYNFAGLNCLVLFEADGYLLIFRLQPLEPLQTIPRTDKMGTVAV